MRIDIDKLMHSKTELEAEKNKLKNLFIELENVDELIRRDKSFEGIHVKLKKEINNIYYQILKCKEYIAAFDRIIYQYQKNEERIIENCERQYGSRVVNFVNRDLSYLDRYIREFNIS